MPDLTGCTVKKGSPGDAAGVLKLINQIQPHLPWSREHFMWQYYGDLGEESTILYLVLSGERVVSMFAAVKKRFCFRGELKDGYMIQEVMTHPDFRGPRGLLRHLIEWSRGDSDEMGSYMYGFPNKLSENSYRRMGWRELGRVPARTMKPVRIEPHEESCLVEGVEQFDERADSIWNGAELEIGVCRDAHFLNWRYARPDTEYLRFYLDRDRGFLVLKLYEAEDGSKVLHLLDLVVERTARELIRPALEFTSNFAVEKQAGRVTAWLFEGHPYAEGFDAGGLRLDPDHDRFVLVRPPGEDFSEILQTGAWHLTQGDSDVY